MRGKLESFCYDIQREDITDQYKYPEGKYLFV